MSKWNKKPLKNYGVNFMLTNYCWALGLPGMWLIQPVTPHWRKLKTIWKILWKLYYSISFQKYIHTWKEYKWNHHIMKQTRPQLDIVCHQVKPLAPVIGYILFSCWWKSSHRAPITQTTPWKYSRLLPMLPQPGGMALLLKMRFTYVFSERGVWI